jgi:hypothetical protein
MTTTVFADNGTIITTALESGILRDNVVAFGVGGAALFVLLVLLAVIVVLRRRRRARFSPTKDVAVVHNNRYSPEVQDFQQVVLNTVRTQPLQPETNIPLPAPVINMSTTPLPQLHIVGIEDRDAFGQFAPNGVPLEVYFTVTDTSDPTTQLRNVQIKNEHLYTQSMIFPTLFAATYTVRAFSYLPGRFRSAMSQRSITILPSPRPIFREVDLGNIQLEVPFDSEVFYTVSSKALGITTTRLMRSEVVANRRHIGDITMLEATSRKPGFAPSNTVPFTLEPVDIPPPTIVFERIGERAFKVIMDCDTPLVIVRYSIEDEVCFVESEN